MQSQLSNKMYGSLHQEQNQINSCNKCCESLLLLIHQNLLTSFIPPVTIRPPGKCSSTFGEDVLCGHVALSHHVLRPPRQRRRRQRLKFPRPGSTPAEPEGLQPKRRAAAVTSNFPPGFILLLLQPPSNIQRRRGFHANSLPAAHNYSRTFSPSIDLLVPSAKEVSVEIDAAKFTLKCCFFLIAAAAAGHQ